jgi:hypothetical protein
MHALVVGADRLGNIPDVLAAAGIGILKHVSGRESAHQKRVVSLPRGVNMVILFTDFLGHNVMKSFREAARAQGLPVLCCRRSTCSVKQALAQCGLDCPGAMRN